MLPMDSLAVLYIYLLQQTVQIITQSSIARHHFSDVKLSVIYGFAFLLLQTYSGPTLTLLLPICPLWAIKWTGPLNGPLFLLSQPSHDRILAMLSISKIEIKYYWLIIIINWLNYFLIMIKWKFETLCIAYWWQKCLSRSPIFTVCQLNIKENYAYNYSLSIIVLNYSLA